MTLSASTPNEIVRINSTDPSDDSLLIYESVVEVIELVGDYLSAVNLKL